MYIATVYFRGLLIITFNGTVIDFEREIHECAFTSEDTMLLSGFFRDCANYYNGVKTKVKSLELN